MPYGPDLANSQRYVDIATAAPKWDFAIVKLGGANVDSLYTSTYYKQQITDLIVANKPRGHYWMIGNANVAGLSVAEQADAYVSRVYEFHPTTDIIMLDNERIDKNTRLFTTQDCINFLERARTQLRVPASRCWIYANKSDFATLDVPRLRAAGYRIHLAFYGTPDTGTKPAEPTNFTYDIWQYTQNATVQNIRIDMNYTAKTVADLFGSTSGLQRTSTESDGIPGNIFWSRMHLLGALGGTPVPVNTSSTDTVMWKGIQTYLRAHFLYRSTITGVPNVYTYQALQRMAAKYGGYTGEITGKMDVASWRGVAKYINTL